MPSLEETAETTYSGPCCFTSRTGQEPSTSCAYTEPSVKGVEIITFAPTSLVVMLVCKTSLGADNHTIFHAPATPVLAISASPLPSKSPTTMESGPQPSAPG